MIEWQRRPALVHTRTVTRGNERSLSSPRHLLFPPYSPQMTAKRFSPAFRIIRSCLSFDERLSWHVIDEAEDFVCEASDQATAKFIARALNDQYSSRRKAMRIHSGSHRNPR